MKRTVNQMDEKDWIIVRLASLLINGFDCNAATSMHDYNRTCTWLCDNLTFMDDAFLENSHELMLIHIEQGFTVAEWPYATVDEPPPPECQLITSEI